MVVCCGNTTRDPLADTLVPFKVTIVAFDVLHDNVLDWPVVMDVGDAEIAPVGAGVDDVVTEFVVVVVPLGDDVVVLVVPPLAEETATLVETTVVPAALVAARKYVVVSAGRTVVEADFATLTPFSVTELAQLVLHVSTDEPPALMAPGEAVIVAPGYRAAPA